MHYKTNERIMSHEAIVQYGRALIEYNGITGSTTAIVIPCEQYHALLCDLLHDHEIAFVLGFVVVALPAIHGTWKKFTKAQINELKDDVLKCCQEINFPNLALANQFSTFASFVFKLCGCEWPEMIEHVFKGEKNRNVIGFLMSKVLRFLKHDEFNKMRDKIYERLVELIPLVDVPVKMRLLSVFCDIQGFRLTASFWEIVWKTVKDCVQKDKERENVLYYILYRFKEKLKDDEKIEPPHVDNENDYIDYITFIGLLTPIDFGRILNILAGIVAKDSDEYPEGIVEKLQLVNTRKLSKEHHAKAVEILKNATEENRESLLVVVLPFLTEAFQDYDNLKDMGLSFFDDLSKGNIYQQQLWCRAIIELAFPLTIKKILSEHTTTTILTMIQSGNESLSGLAFSALNSLFENFAVTEPASIKKVFVTYDHLNDIQKEKFIRSIQTLIEIGGFEISLLPPI